MNVDRDAVARAERVFAVGENFDMRKKASEQSAKARSGEEILMIAFEQMPGDYAPVVEIRKQLHVRDRKESALPDYSGNLGDKGFRISRVLEHFNANGGIGFGVSAGKTVRFEIDRAKREFATFENFRAMSVGLETKPRVPGGNQGRTIRASAAPHVDDRSALRQAGTEQLQNFGPRFFDRGARSVNIFAVKQDRVFRRDDFAVGAVAQARRNKMNGLFRGEPGIVDSACNAQDGVPRFGRTRGHSSEHAKAESLIIGRPAEKKSCLGATEVIDVSANHRRFSGAIAQIDRAGNENGFVVNLLSGRRRFDEDFGRGGHGLGSHILGHDESSAIFRNSPRETCGILKCDR